MSDSLLEEFSIEAFELLDDAEDALLLIEGADEDGLKSAYDRIFRSFHSLKGSAGMMGLMEIQKHMHLSEDLFEKLNGNFSELHEHVDFFLDVIDHTRLLLKGESANFDYDIAKIDGLGTASEQEVCAVSKIKNLYTKNTFHIAVAGSRFESSQLFSEVQGQIKIKKIETFETFISKKMYLNFDALLIDIEYLREIEDNLKDDIHFFVFADIEQLESIDSKITPCFEGMGVNHFFSNLIMSKAMMKYNKAFERSLKLLYYQYSDLDRYLKQRGRDLIRNTLKSEMKDITDAKKGFYK